VLAACLHDQAYDPQCEASRAAWLLSMFDGSSEYPAFSCAIVDALEQESNTWDSQQLCELAALMAKRGDRKAREALRRRALQQAATAGSDPWVGAEQLLELDGVGAATELARRYGHRLKQDAESNPPVLDDLTQDREVLQHSEEVLQELAGADAEIAAYLAYWRQDRADRARHQTDASTKTQEELREARRERTRMELPVEKILRDASEETGSFPGRYMRFGQVATPEELAVVLRKLEQEAADGVCLRLLWVFRRVALPYVPQEIWRLANSTNREVRSAALEALAQLCDQRVGELGRTRLRSHDFTEDDSSVLDLFIRNYLPGDEDLIVAALQGLTPSAENAHSLGWSILDITENNTSASLLPLLDWAYEINPCSNCRLRTLKLLRGRGRIHQGIFEECLFDADEDVRNFAAEVRGTHQG
jgi:hypothetical protein